MGAAPAIVVLGVGNTLMQDDGVGVWALRALAEAYDLPPSVRLIDAGVAGFRYLPELGEAEHLLILDAVEGGGPPGTLYRLAPEDFPARQGPTLSAHEVGIAEILSMAEFLGKLPKTRILGVQPIETCAVGLDLTPPLQQALPRIVETVAEELRALGVEVCRRGEAKQR
jgi:hydrogenase maturation protease